jgi:hypothetical protein
MGKYKLSDTPSGYKTLLYIDPESSREFRLHSAYDPLTESEKIVNTFMPGRSNLIIVAGLGLGYHIKYLRQKYSNYLIVAIEKDSEVLEIVRQYYPENLKDVSVIHSKGAIASVFEQLDIAMIRGVSAYIHRPSYLLDKEYYDSILKDIKEYFSSRVSDLLTRFEFEENWISHIFSNVHYLYSSTPVSNLFGKFRDIPGIIVSAGPSLKKNVNLLKDLRDRALIVCVDTALKVLQKHNIVPHLVMTLDSQKYSLKHFLGLKDMNPALLADIVSYPRLLESYSGEKIFSTTSKFFSDRSGNLKRETTPVWDWVEQYTGPIGDIQSGGSVATSVFDFFLNIGCSPIILVGQDLAYTGREIHCTGTHHNEEWLPKTSRFVNLETINQNVIRRRKIKYVEAFGGKGTVISDFVFDIYKYWFKNSAGKVSIPVINATEGGARIDNTEERTLREIAGTIGTVYKKPEEILKQSLTGKNVNNPGSPEKLFDAINSAISELEALKQSGLMPGNSGSLCEQELLDMLNRGKILKLIKPFLSRTYVYLTRHPDLSQKKTSELLISDIRVSADKLIRMLKVCKKNLSNIR